MESGVKWTEEVLVDVDGGCEREARRKGKLEITARSQLLNGDWIRIVLKSVDWWAQLFEFLDSVDSWTTETRLEFSRYNIRVVSFSLLLHTTPRHAGGTFSRKAHLKTRLPVWPSSTVNYL